MPNKVIVLDEHLRQNAWRATEHNGPLIENALNCAGEAVDLPQQIGYMVRGGISHLTLTIRR